jgi:hypothetical protein
VAVVTIVVASVIVISTTAILASAIVVGVLHISAAPALGDDARTIGPRDGYAPAPVQVVVNVHISIGNMHIADPAIGAFLNRTAIRGVGYSGSLGHGLAGRRNFASSAGSCPFASARSRRTPMNITGRGAVVCRRRCRAAVRTTGRRAMAGR